MQPKYLKNACVATFSHHSDKISLFSFKVEYLEPIRFAQTCVNKQVRC